MADYHTDSMPSLLNLEDELSCSICLCPFECPVTIPCGHNFCQDCLLSSWEDTYSCPQCRTLFATKPELKKNTVLSNVVETFKMRSSKEAGQPNEETEVKVESVILCDTCMTAKASKTCLTCMASFCEEHLNPHRENPIFRAHQLQEPLDDLQQRICPDHHKLMEFFCVQHCRSICSLCLQQVHKGCDFSTPDEQKDSKQSDLRSKRSVLEGKIEKNNLVISQIDKMQTKLQDTAANKKGALKEEYQQIREMLDKNEQEALIAVDKELMACQGRLQGLNKKFTSNVEKLCAAKDEINILLDQSQNLTFLEVSFDLPSVASFEPHAPGANLETKAVKSAHAFSVSLKEYIAHIMTQPMETRLQILKAREGTVAPQASSHPPVGKTYTPIPLSVYPGPPFMIPQRFPFRPRFPGSRPPFREEQKIPQPNQRMTRTKSIEDLLNKQENYNKADPGQQKRGPRNKKTDKQKMRGAQSVEDLLKTLEQDQPRERASKEESRGKRDGNPEGISPNVTSAVKRQDLLKYGTALTFDPKTVHKRISLSDDFTTATVTENPTSYPDGPARFSVCSQVFTSRGFSAGRHYWEVKMSSSNFIGIGLAYNSMDRKGPASRLGRNAQSWCVEWFNVKLSAWHDGSETVLLNPNPKRVGVLLNCEEGTATFYSVADRISPFHTFVFPFADAIYPAFWIFSSGSSVTLCKLQD